MQRHRLWQKQHKVFNQYPEFKQHALRVISTERPSGAKDKSVRKFQEKQEYYQDANEDTIIYNLLQLIIKPERRVTKEASVQDSNVKDDEHSYTVEDWWDDGLAVEVNRQFRKTMLPNAYLDQGLEAVIAKALAKDDGMKDPKPDFIFGIKTDKYPRPDGTQHTNPLLAIVPKMHNAFLLVEGKSEKGEMSQAENQACRGGATLVNAARTLLAELGRKDVVGPDYDTYVYSVTMDAKVMDVWVNWAQVNEDGVARFHMNMIASKSLTDDGALPYLRRTLHNILDWGCIERSEMLKERYDMLYAHEKKVFEQRLADNQADKTSNGKKRPRIK